eukprot:11542951-Karenia_brevis.AAC.1
MADMAELVGMSVYQPSQVQADEQFTGPQGQTHRPRRPKHYQIRLSSQQWATGPQGLMSLGEMLQMA